MGVSRNRGLSAAVLAALAAVGLSSGCAAVLVGGGAAAGAGAYYYLRSELKRTYAATYDNTWDATKAALEDLELKIVRSPRDKMSGEMVALRGNGQEITARIESLSEHSTQVGVRVGTFGDRNVSSRVHDTILATLQKRGAIVKTSE